MAKLQWTTRQTWLVTGGNIPWVTVGLANANYQIISWGGAAKTVSNGNEGDWYGARVDLNKNYLPNEKFTYNFTIIQRNFDISEIERPTV